MRQNIFKYAKKALPFIGLILLVIYIFYYLELNNPLQLLKSKELILKIITSIFFPIAIILTIPRIMVRNYAWQIILKEQNINISFWKSLKIFLIGYFYGSFTPGYYGQLMRIPYLKEKTYQPYGKLFVNTLIEIIIRGAAIYSMIALGLIIFLDKISIFDNALYIIFIWIAIFFTIPLLFIKKERGEKFFFTLVKYIIPNNLKKYFNNFIGTFYKDFPKIRVLFYPFLISFLSWVLIFTQEYMFVLALDVNIPYYAFILLFPIANVAGFIPITFAGIGVREITAVLIFTSLYSVTSLEVFVISIMGFLVVDVLTGFVGFLLSLTETVDKKSFLNILD